MSQQPHSAVTDSGPAPEVDPERIAELLDVLADHDVQHALSDMEQMVARLRAGAEEVEVAREILLSTPEVLRKALLLQAARNGATRTETTRTETARNGHVGAEATR